MVFNVQDHGNQPLRRDRDVDDMNPPTVWNCTICTTGTKTTLSNCNCEISMVRTMVISHCAKTGVSTTGKELQLLNCGTCRWTTTGTSTTLSENCTMSMKSWTMGNCLCATTGRSGKWPAPVVAQRSASTPCPGTATVESPETSTVSTVRICLCSNRSRCRLT